MPRTTFDTLPADARLWIFAADRELAPREREYLLGTVDQFLDHWQAHGHPLTSGRDLRHDRFLLIAVDEAAAGASGCGTTRSPPRSRRCREGSSPTAIRCG